jgi:hypothetical protein
MANSSSKLQDKKIDIKIALSSLWMALMFVYLYADILSFYKPGVLAKIIDGYMGLFKVSQLALIFAAMLMLISIIMIVLSLILSANINRKLNIIIGGVLSIVGIGNLIGEDWIFYLIYGLIEIGVLIIIIILSIKWPKEE